MQKTLVQFLGREDLLEKEMTTHSSVLAWEIPRTEEPGGLQSMGSQGLDTTERLNNDDDSSGGVSSETAAGVVVDPQDSHCRVLFTGQLQTADVDSSPVSEARRPMPRCGQAEPPLLCLLPPAGRPSSLLGAPRL